RRGRTGSRLLADERPPLRLDVQNPSRVARADPGGRVGPSACSRRRLDRGPRGSDLCRRPPRLPGRVHRARGPPRARRGSRDPHGPAPPEVVDGPADRVESYRLRGARYFVDLSPGEGDGPDPARLALHESVRRRYNVMLDGFGVLIADLTSPRAPEAHGTR